MTMMLNAAGRAMLRPNGRLLLDSVCGICVPLGSASSFIACSCAIRLKLNDNQYGDNSGSWDVVISPAPGSGAAYTIPSRDYNGVLVTGLIRGQTYNVTATGLIWIADRDAPRTPDGTIPTSYPETPPPATGPFVDGPFSSFECPTVGGVNSQWRLVGMYR